MLNRGCKQDGRRFLFLFLFFGGVEANYQLKDIGLDRNLSNTENLERGEGNKIKGYLDKKEIRFVLNPFFL